MTEKTDNQQEDQIPSQPAPSCNPPPIDFDMEVIMKMRTDEEIKLPSSEPPDRGGDRPEQRGDGA